MDYIGTRGFLRIVHANMLGVTRQMNPITQYFHVNTCIVNFIIVYCLKPNEFPEECHMPLIGRRANKTFLFLFHFFLSDFVSCHGFGSFPWFRRQIMRCVVESEIVIFYSKGGIYR